MTRSLRAQLLPTRNRRAKGRALSPPRAFVALVLGLLQVLGALHFALVPHRFSAALGGVVHVHGAANAVRASRAQQRPASTTAWAADQAACVADLCPFADAPQSPLPDVDAFVTGEAAFGASDSLSENPRDVATKWRILRSAPKTSPPV